MFGFGKKKHKPDQLAHLSAPQAVAEASARAMADQSVPPGLAPAEVENQQLAKGAKKGGFFARLRGRETDQPAVQAPPDNRPEHAPAQSPEITSQPATAPEPTDKGGAEATRASLLAAAAEEAEAQASAEQRRGVLASLKTGLSRTRAILNADIGDLILGRKEIDEDLLEELEALLLTADVGVPATNRIIQDLSARVRRHELSKPSALVTALRAELKLILSTNAAPVRQPASGLPQVILMVGVNGVGKTTTIGKLAKQLQAEGNSIMLAAGDTFRAAAVEQLQTWGERNRVPVISQGQGADSASVIYDALQAATARGIDVLIADTAGRLHTKSNLMEELKKIARVMQKIDPEAPHEVLLVVDATTGQNALHQAQEFHRAIPLTGIALTKLDGTAKGGIVFALADQLRIPIRFIGVGEQIDDLRYFQPNEFLDALLSP